MAKIWKTQGDLEVLHLGLIVVGRIMRAGGKNNKPRWMFDLAGVSRTWRTEESYEHARLACEITLSEWMRKASVVEAHP